MPSTASPHLRLDLQETGENLSTWGERANNGVFLLIEQAIAGELAKEVSGDVTLSAANYATDEARNAVLRFTGSGGTVTIPSAKKVYLVISEATGPIVITAGAGSVTVEPGTRHLVFCDGATVHGILNSAVVSEQELATGLTQAREYTDEAVRDIQAAALTTEQQAALTLVTDAVGQSGVTAGHVLTNDGSQPVWAAPPDPDTRAARWRYR